MLEVSDKEFICGNATGALTNAIALEPEVVIAVLPDVVIQIDKIETVGTITKRNIALLLACAADEDRLSAKCGTKQLMTLASCSIA